jgi:geranylgeranyl diphosphate synthase type II
MDVQAYLHERGQLVDAFLDKALPTPELVPAALAQAMRHLVFPGGKRLRPALVFAAAEAVGAPPERALSMAAAVELVHTYSLVHDDLPCMDDDDERRGRPTVHVAYGEAVAVLAGDALQALAFEVLAMRGARSGSTERVLGAIRDLAEAAGARFLVGGQVDDLSFEPGSADAARVEQVHLRKSAALIAASVVGGARLGGADAATLARLRRFGEAIGIAFQIADDLLDRDEDGACSLVRALGVDGASARAEELLEEALALVDDLGEKAEPLRDLARFAVRRQL